jgi:hypothetical protein
MDTSVFLGHPVQTDPVSGAAVAQEGGGEGGEEVAGQASGGGLGQGGGVRVGEGVAADHVVTKTPEDRDVGGEGGGVGGGVRVTVTVPGKGEDSQWGMGGGGGGGGEAEGAEENFLIGTPPAKYLVYWRRFLLELFWRDSSLPTQVYLPLVVTLKPMF